MVVGMWVQPVNGTATDAERTAAQILQRFILISSKK
jgi:hypothetical protein